MLKGFFKYKGLIYELAIRDIKLRYRKPYLGFFWMLIIPFVTALVYKVLFSDFLHVASSSCPFFIYLLTALLPWSYFCSAVQTACRSILDNRNIVGQVSFPKYILPVSTVLANLINFLPTILVLLGFLAVFHVKVGISLLFLPAVILIQTCMIMGLAFLVSSLQVIYRDVEYISQVLLMVMFFLTPGVYTLEELISKTSPLFSKIYMLNPLVGILNLYRIAFIGDYFRNMPGQVSSLNTLFVPILASLVSLSIGIFVFSRQEKKFFDHVNL